MHGHFCGPTNMVGVGSFIHFHMKHSMSALCHILLKYIVLSSVYASIYETIAMKFPKQYSLHIIMR